MEDNRLSLTGRQKKILVSMFGIIIFTPLALGAISGISGKKCDVRLGGYTDQVSKPEWSMEQFLSGSYQNAYTGWYDDQLKPSGVLIRTYNQIRFSLFRLAGNTTVRGAGNNVFEKTVIESFNGLGAYDYSAADKQAEMAYFVEEMQQVQDKLAAVGKSFYLYIPGSKVQYMPESIPNAYQSNQDAYGILECFKEDLKGTNLHYYFAEELLPELEYPAFYDTGTHWSRTYEQRTSNRVIADLAELTGKKYRQIGYDSVSSSSTPYWRDTDIYDLINVWARPKTTYYQYDASPLQPEEYDKMRILLKGDSYGEGIRKDVLDTYPHEIFYYVNYINYVSDNHWQEKLLYNNWDNFDWQYYLDQVDVVVIEMCHQNLISYSDGFVHCLNEFLDTYQPSTVDDTTYLDVLDVASGMPWNYNSLGGIFDAEGTFAWVKPYSEIILKDEALADGLELELIMPDQLAGVEHRNMHFYLNGKHIYDVDLPVGSNTIVIPSDAYEAQANGIYDFEIYCDAYFNPARDGMSADDRDLAFRLNYAGRVR